jgi:hypothetical protein
MDDDLWDTHADDVNGDDVVSISSLAKQPWLDGWVTARSLAVRYLKVPTTHFLSFSPTI